MPRDKDLEQLCDTPGCNKSHTVRMNCYRRINKMNDSIYEVCQLFYQTCDSLNHYDYMATCMQVHWMEQHPDSIPGEWIDNLMDIDPLGYLKASRDNPFRFKRFLEIVEERRRAKNG